MTHPFMIRNLFYCLGLVTLPVLHAADSIPDRPEKLPVRPLVYEAPQPEDYRVVLRSGPVAYVVPDRELPLANISILIRAGQYLEPDHQAGLADLTGSLMVLGGAGDRDADTLEETLAFLAAEMNASIGETQGSVSLNLLSKDLDEGFRLLRDVLTRPRFQEDRFTLQKEQMLQAMKRRNDDSAAIEGREREFLALGESFWANRYPTEASLASIQRSDLEKFHRRWIHPGNFIVAVNGDFDRDAMVAKLEELFANWPWKGETSPAIPSKPEFAEPGVYLVNKEVNQGRVAMMLPGLMREDPDYIPVLVMNDILGGGGFTSRIVNRVRSDEGLAYSAGSRFSGGVYYPSVFRAGFQSKSRTVAKATSIILEEMRRMTSELVSPEELETSKRSFIDTFPRNFATKSQVASTFANDELTGRHAREPRFWSTFRDQVDAVTREDLQRVAQRFFKTDEMVILVVGNREEILQGHPDHPARLQELVPGGVHDLPLRDPLTMKPVQP